MLKSFMNDQIRDCENGRDEAGIDESVRDMATDKEMRQSCVQNYVKF